MGVVPLHFDTHVALSPSVSFRICRTSPMNFTASDTLSAPLDSSMTRGGESEHSAAPFQPEEEREVKGGFSDLIQFAVC